MSKVLLLLGLVWILPTAVNAQQVKLTPQAYSERKARCIEPKEPHRREKNDVAYNDGKPALIKQTIYEVLRPGIVRETFSSNGTTPVRQVVVTLDDFIYKRLGDGPWEKMDWYFRHPITEEQIEILNTDKYWTENRHQDGKTFTILGTSIEQKIGGERVVRRDEISIDASGACDRTVTTYESLSSKTILRIVTTTIEHDETIRIEPPIK